MIKKLNIRVPNNLKYTFSAQVIVLIFSLLRSLILPKFLNLESFGYWQVYMLYASYVGIFSLGFNDGIYLKYGKYNYDDLPQDKLRIAIKLFAIMIAMFTIISCILSVFEKNTDRQFALLFSGLNIFVVGLYGVFSYVLQITNRMKLYSLYSILDKILFIIVMIVFIFYGYFGYKWFIIIDLCSKILITILLISSCKNLLFGKNISIKEGILEFKDNIKVGIILMIASLMSMLTTGIGKIIVENLGNIQEYAFYAFSISITNFVILFVVSVSLALYPELKRLPEENYKRYFIKLEKIISIFMICSLFLYFPGYLFIIWFLPKYMPSLEYLNLLFGVVSFQIKISILNNTFYNVIREEKSMLRHNMISVALFTILVLILFITWNSLWIIAFFTFLTMLFRCYRSEIFLMNKMNIKMNYKLILEIFTIILFIIVTALLNIWMSLIVFVFVSIIFFSLGYYKNIKSIIRKS